MTPEEFDAEIERYSRAIGAVLLITATTATLLALAFLVAHRNGLLDSAAPMAYKSIHHA